MGKVTVNKVLITFIILAFFISRVQPQQNDDMEEAELSPPEIVSDDKFETKTSAPTTLPPPPPPPSEQPFPQNILTRELKYPPPFDNSSCIIFRGAIQLHLNSSFFFGKNTDLKIDVPVNATGNGNCGNVTQTLLLEWKRESINTSQEIEYSLGIEFGFRPNNTKQYDIQMISLLMTTYNTTTNLKTLQGNFTSLAKGPFYPVDFNHSFLCISRSVMTGTNLTVLTSSLEFEAFRPRTSTQSFFSSPQVCSKDNSTVGTVIGIAVGSVLVILLALLFGTYVGFRYGYCHWPCCNRRNSGYQRLDI